MPQIRHLGNPPITEAIVDIRVKARSNFDPQSFEQLKTELASDFPQSERRVGQKVSFQLFPTGGGAPAIEGLGVQGYFFRSADAKLVAQFRVDGFTLNRLKPYTSWGELLPTALGLWRRYCSIAHPEVVTRIALRYINHIPLTADPFDFADYLRAAPIVPAELPQDVSAFFCRVTIHDRVKDLDAHVVQAVETGKNQKGTLLLDIDAFRVVDVACDDPRLEACLLDLRMLKNTIFFGYLTENTLRRFE